MNPFDKLDISWINIIDENNDKRFLKKKQDIINVDNAKIKILLDDDLLLEEDEIQSNKITKKISEIIMNINLDKLLKETHDIICNDKTIMMMLIKMLKIINIMLLYYEDKYDKSYDKKIIDYLIDMIHKICDKYNIYINKYNCKNDKKYSRCSYNFCENHPICFNHYWKILGENHSKKCVNDHIVFDKLYFDIKNLSNLIQNKNNNKVTNGNNNNDTINENDVKDDNDMKRNIIISLNTIKYVTEKHVIYIYQLKNTIKNNIMKENLHLQDLLNMEK